MTSLYTFFYKNPLNDLNHIEDLNSEYELKRRQRKKESFSSMKEKEFKINTEKKMLKK